MSGCVELSCLLFTVGLLKVNGRVNMRACVCVDEYARVCVCVREYERERECTLSVTVLKNESQGCVCQCRVCVGFCV